MSDLREIAEQQIAEDVLELFLSAAIAGGQDVTFTPSQLETLLKSHRLYVAEREKSLSPQPTEEMISLSDAKLLASFIESPCGHSSRYAYTEDGGKHIVCLLCDRVSLSPSSSVVEAQLRRDAYSALYCLNLAVEPDIAKDVYDKVHAYIEALRKLVISVPTPQEPSVSPPVRMSADATQIHAAPLPERCQHCETSQEMGIPGCPMHIFESTKPKGE